MKLSVIIPALNEAATIADAVARASRIGDEVIVADGGSTDGTPELARAARVITAPRGRGPQLSAGANAATGDVLLFLHADVVAPEAVRSAIERAGDVVGGNFFLRFVPESPWARAFTIANDLRRRALAIYYGDSGIFIRRDVYARIGGFPAQPILEDYELVKRMEREGKTAYIRDVVLEASARRFAAKPARTLAIWVSIQAAYSAGVPADRLARFYADLR